ncbi:MAG: cytidine deaminase [Ignavibacteriales bacterium CG_4_9_14_3_um_filter_34_10]|nr:MAG: cytidine deaminase [Ignavibacteriales bacterium CG_4_9_14_3_um_filter_34_10]
MYKKLIKKAEQAKSKSYSPYSNFRVGAAIMTNKGNIYDGANIESASFSLTICAERTALFSAILNKEKKFTAIALTSDMNDFISPCGACRQVLYEHCGGDIDVLMTNKKLETKTVKLKELLPFSFGKDFKEK